MFQKNRPRQSFINLVAGRCFSPNIFILENKKEAKTCLFSSNDPDENRTRVTAVKGRCLNRLTTGPNL